MKLKNFDICECNYLEDLITRVHIIQLKLYLLKIGNESKKIDINIPSLKILFINVI